MSKCSVPTLAVVEWMPWLQNLKMWLLHTCVWAKSLVSAYHKYLKVTPPPSLVMIVAGEVTVQLEKAVLKSSFSRLGGLQLDREVVEQKVQTNIHFTF